MKDKLEYLKIDASILYHPQLKGDFATMMIISYIIYRLKHIPYWTFSACETAESLSMPKWTVERRYRKLKKLKILKELPPVASTTGYYIPLEINLNKFEMFLANDKLSPFDSSERQIVALPSLANDKLSCTTNDVLNITKDNTSITKDVQLYTTPVSAEQSLDPDGSIKNRGSNTNIDTQVAQPSTSKVVTQEAKRPVTITKQDNVNGSVGQNTACLMPVISSTDNLPEYVVRTNLYLERYNEDWRSIRPDLAKEVDMLAKMYKP